VYGKFSLAVYRPNKFSKEGVVMDRISRALDQARNKVAKVHNKQVDEPKKPIVYTGSQPVELSRQILHENRIITEIDHSQIIDAYGLLRTRVLKLMKQNNWKTIGITSPDASVGKTVTSINLSISIAMEHNYSVLLVDADLRKPGISKTLGIYPEVGLNSYLLRDKSIEDIFLHPQIDHLVIVPTNKVESGSSELLSSPRMINFVEEAKQRYKERVLVFDLPPILVGDDVVAFSQNLDALLLVVEDGKTQSDELLRATDLLQDVNLLGVVLNKATEDSNQLDYYN